MGNTSATGGTLLPAAPLPADDDALDSIFQSLVASITGIDGSLVRPRWQTVVPKQPPPSINWCAIGVTVTDEQDGPLIQTNKETGATTYTIHEEINVLSSFYGPQANQNAKQLRNGLRILQNTEALLASQMRFIMSGPIRAVPVFINQQWIKKQDMSLRFRREYTTTYPIESLVVGIVDLTDGNTINDLIVVPPGTPIVE
jgi:hypothetical protein